MRKCKTCLCRTCMNTCCDFKNCDKRKIDCDKYSGFKQISIFEPHPGTKYQSIPRYTWEHYGIDKYRYDKLTEYIQSGAYADIALYAANKADKELKDYILLSVTKNKSYDALEKLWARGKIKRIPCSRTGFYGVRRYFYHLFDVEVRRIGK